VLELSLREALRLGHNYMGTKHILLAFTGHNRASLLGEWNIIYFNDIMWGKSKSFGGEQPNR
jgi:hypothetical protein